MKQILQRIVLLTFFLGTWVAQAQDREVTGIVSDANGMPIPGVTVQEKGTSNGTVTDFDGGFSFSVSDENNTILVFSFLGYRAQEIPIASQSEFEVIMEEDLESLDEVVVVGYGTQRKANLTGSVSAVSGEDIAQRPVMRASAALQGHAPGVTVTQRSGQPGADDGTIRIRGIGTLGNSNPLVLIDGIEGSLDGVNPNDIENITVLKDAASASIYGSRAANGVILVQTKKGGDEKLTLQYNNYIGWQEFTDLPNYADGYTYMNKLNEAYRNMGRTPLYSEEYLSEYQENKNIDPDYYPDTNWQREVYSGSGAIQSHFLSVRGGEKVNVAASLGYQDQEGVIPSFGSERYTFRLNATMDILDNLQGTILSSVRRSIQSSPGHSSSGIINSVNRFSPIYAAQFTDGRYGATSTGSNPLALIEEGGFGRNTYDNFRATFQVNYQPFEGADLELNFTPHHNSSDGKRFINAVSTFEVDREEPAFTVPARADLTRSSTKSLETTLRMLARYNKSLNNHNFKLLAGFEQIESTYETFNASREGFEFPQYPVLDAGSIEYMRNGGSGSEWALRSFFGRINYDFSGKYLFEANLRRDGSSRFAEGQKWGLFPSFSAGWRISEEEFLRDVNWLSDLKVRASWGELGNQLIGNYPFASSISLGINYAPGGLPATGAAQVNMANSLISWETTTSSNIGIDLGLFNNRLNLAFDYFKRNTTDILLDLPIPGIIGLARPTQNAGEVENTGWDLSLNYRKAEGEFNYNVGFNLSDVRNEIVDLKDAGPFISTYTINQVGSPINALYGYQSLGLFRSQEEVDASPVQIGDYGPGDIKYADIDGDGDIDEEDRTEIGSSIPRYTFGLNFNASYKNFDFSFLVQGVGKADVLLRRDAGWAFYNSGKISSWQLDSWTPENTDATYPRLIADRSHNNFEDSSFWVYDAAYARLKNLTIGYSLPSSLISRLPIANLRIYASGDNLFTIHDLPDGWDPERPNGDATTYPITSTYTIGVNITL